MARSRHIIKVEQSREKILFGVCLRVSQLLNTCSVPKDAVFLQENDNSFPLVNMVGVEFWRQVPCDAGIKELDRAFSQPERKMERKEEKRFMAGCVRFWVWFPAAASCIRRRDSRQGVSQTCLACPHQLAELDPDGWNESLPTGYVVTVVWGGPRN